MIRKWTYCLPSKPFPPEKADTVLHIVDRWTKIMQQVNGQIWPARFSGCG